ncbi:MAG: CoA transferase [Spirochaetales bacterium]|nr:CoA transferase [Spirochaetales bacterium]
MGKSRALEGVRVADLSHVLAAPTTSMILADLGAEVIHIEPPSGDDAREFGPFVNGESAYFISINRNKKSLVLDLKSEKGREVLRDIIRVSDVVLENFKPTTMKKLGFSYEECRSINSKIIYASICGFGHDTPPEYAEYPAYDMIAQAYSGLMSICGPEGGAPVRVGTSIGDITSGHQCAISIMAALRHRDRTGEGQCIDHSMVDGLLYILENALVRYTVEGKVPGPLGTTHPSITPFQAFPTEDGWIVIAVGNDAIWKRFCTVLELPLLIDDERFASNGLRTENRKELSPVLEARFRQKTTSVWLDILRREDVPCSPINTIDQIAEDPVVSHRRMIARIDQPGVGPVRIAASPFRMSATPGEVYAPAPRLGEHSIEVLREVLGYGEEAIRALRETKVIFTNEDIDRESRAK